MKMDYAQMYFNEPVDAEALGIPQYYEVIKVGKRTLDPCVDRGPSSRRAWPMRVKWPVMYHSTFWHP